eukprot:SM000107S14063  [mRNA]  locus=s107:199641:201800:- [translate_table: standard]
MVTQTRDGCAIHGIELVASVDAKGMHPPGTGKHKVAPSLFVYGTGATTVQAFQAGVLPTLNKKYSVSINYAALGSGAPQRLVGHVLSSSMLVNNRHIQATSVAGGPSVHAMHSSFTEWMQPTDRPDCWPPVAAGAGRAALISGAADYAFSDVPFASTEEVSLKGVVKYTMPFVLETISVFVNIPGATAIQFSPTVLASIFQGTITTWDNAAIKALNPKLVVPKGAAIKPIHRIDSSGTTNLFTGWLQVAASNWKLAAGSTITWPASFKAANGSGGMVTALKATPYGIAYIGTGVGAAGGFLEASLLNAAGKYIKAGQADLYASVPRPLPAATTSWAGVTLLNKPGAQTFPITSFVYYFVRMDATKVGPKGRNGGLLKSYSKYIMSPTGQALVPAYDFTILPSPTSAQNLAAVAGIKTINGVRTPF